MSLEKRWTEAAAGTNAAKARTIANAAATGPQTPAQLVNFFDGTGRSTGNTVADEYQTGFTGNKLGDFRYNAGGKVPGTYTLSKFLDKATNKSDVLFTDSKFTTLVNGDSAGKNATGAVVHKFTPSAKFQNANSLSEFAKGRI